MARKRSGMMTIPKDQLDSLAHDFDHGFDPLNARLVFSIRALAQRVNDRANAWLQPLGLTATKFNYLAALYAQRERGLTLNELSLFVHTSNASVTSMVDSLDREQLVKRKNNPDDGRSTVVSLTPTGRALVKRAFTEHHGRIDTALKPLAARDRRALLGLLLAVGAAFEE
jgi:DNA-binding MarR family transcriptional regulator